MPDNGYDSGWGGDVAAGGSPAPGPRQGESAEGRAAPGPALPLMDDGRLLLAVTLITAAVTASVALVMIGLDRVARGLTAAAR